MSLLSVFSRLIIGGPLSTVIEEIHVRLLNKWIEEHNLRFIHAQCTWHVAIDHPYAGAYAGRQFYDCYTRHLTETYQNWNEVVTTVIGSQIGGIVVGNYHFMHQMNGLWYTAPFIHFYKIQQGQICGVRFFMGDVSLQCHSLSPIPKLVSLPESSSHS